MLILAIETSCDETSIAILEYTKGRVSVRSNVTSSQVALHTQYGGVVPTLAAREHVKNLPIVFKRSLVAAKTDMEDIDAVAVTSGPGLIPALLVGVAFAKTLAWKHDLPLIGTNHIEGHMYSLWLDSELTLASEKVFPTVSLVVSGNHTQLVLMNGQGKYKLIGQTVDDAAGEAFDKIARLLGFPYPGGPAIAKMAMEARNQNDKLQITFPRPMIHSRDFNFSFSGLKTAVLYKVRDLQKKYSITELQPIIAREAQQAIIDVLIAKTKRAAAEFHARSLMLSGGVSANTVLRETLQQLGTELNIPVYIPQRQYTTDNAAMIGMAAIARLNGQKPTLQDFPWKQVQADANWEIV